MQSKTTNNIIDKNSEFISLVISGNNIQVAKFYCILIPFIKQVIRKLDFSFRVNEIEALTHDLFLKIYSQLPKFDRNKNFNSWGYSVIKNSLIDLKRIDKIKLISVDETPKLNQLLGTTLSPEDLIIKQEKREELFELINRLNSTDKKIITEYYFLEKSLKELSDDYQISVNSISIRIHRAVKKLKSLPNLPEYPLLHHE